MKTIVLSAAPFAAIVEAVVLALRHCVPPETQMIPPGMFTFVSRNS